MIGNHLVQAVRVADYSLIKGQLRFKTLLREGLFIIETRLRIQFETIGNLRSNRFVFPQRMLYFGNFRLHHFQIRPANQEID